MCELFLFQYEGKPYTLSEVPPLTAVMSFGRKIRQRCSNQPNVETGKKISLNSAPNKAISTTVAGSERVAGVFTDGVVPSHAVLVIDEDITCVNSKDLSDKCEVISGNKLNVPGYLSLIEKSSFYNSNQGLFIVFPGVEFFTSNLHFLTEVNVDCQVYKDVDSKDLLESFASLIREFSIKVDEQDLSLLTNIDAKHLAAFSDPEIKKSLRSNVTRDILRVFLHNALAIRSAVLKSSYNCEVIFMGLPVGDDFVDGCSEDESQVGLKDIIECYYFG